MKYAAPVSRLRPPKPQPPPREIDVIAEDLRSTLSSAEVEEVANLCSAGRRAVTRELGKLLNEFKKPKPKLQPLHPGSK